MPRTFREIFYESLQESTAHGLNRIFQTNNSLLRLMWVVCIFAAWTIMVVNLFLLVKDYASYQKRTRIAVEYNSTMTFPAITFCNLNPLDIKNNKTGEILRTNLENSHNSNPLYPTLYEQLLRVGRAVGDDGVAHEQALRYTMRARMYNATADDLMSARIKNMDMMCSFQGRSCAAQIRSVKPWLHGQYGACYTFFPQQEKDEKTGMNLPSITGPDYGLDITFIIRIDNYLPLIPNDVGIQVQIHSADSVPFPEDNGITISQRRSASVGLLLNVVKRLPKPYGDNEDCIDMDTFNYRVGTPGINYYVMGERFEKELNYTTKVCIKACLQDLYLEECNCVDPSHIAKWVVNSSLNGNTARPCDFGSRDDSRCQYKALKHIQACDKECIEPCQLESYETELVMNTWPNEKYIDYVIDSSPVFKRIPEHYEILRNNMVNLKVYFKSFSYQLLEELPKMNGWDLASSIGGTLGLYAGCSLLSLLEVVQLVIQASERAAAEAQTAVVDARRRRNKTLLAFMMGVGMAWHAQQDREAMDVRFGLEEEEEDRVNATENT